MFGFCPKNVDFLLKCSDFVLKMFDFVLKMLGFAGQLDDVHGGWGRFDEQPGKIFH